MKIGNSTKQSNRELFIQEVDKHWVKLKDNQDTIFENIEIQLDADNKYEEFKENSTESYMEYISESSLYNKKKYIGEYFWDRIVGDLYEHTLDIMARANLLEEAHRSFEHSYKIETTARLILENGIFARFEQTKKKELVDNLIESSFYPLAFDEKMADINLHVLEEGFWRNVGNAGEWAGRQITNTARSLRSLYILVTMILVSPATVLLANTGTQAFDKAADKFVPGNNVRKGTSPSMQKFYGILDNLSPVKWIFSFLTKDQKQLYDYLKKANTLDNEYVQDILKTAGGDSTKMISKCWDQNKIQIEAKDRNSATNWEVFKHVISGKGLSNFIRNPQYQDEKQLMVILGQDAGDPKYQKRFYDFRVCVYDKLFEVILGYTKAIYSMDNESYEIIKAANSSHQTKNYKAFFDLKPKQDSDAAMFSVMKALVAIDDIARTLDNSKGVLAADKYINQFSHYLNENIKAVYKELDEMASLRQYNSDRYDEEDPDEDTRAEKMAEERFNQKKSIFAD